MIGFEWTAVKFLWYYYYIFTCFVYFTLYGMMLITLTPGVQVGAIMASFFLSFWNLFSGFLIPRKQIPIWWRWYYWGSPVAWTIYGVVASQLGDLTSQVEIPGIGVMTVESYLKENLGYNQDFLPVSCCWYHASSFYCCICISLCICNQASQLPKEMNQLACFFFSSFLGFFSFFLSLGNYNVSMYIP